MRKTNYLEIIGILSLSFILTSALSISCSIPAMIEEFAAYSRATVEFSLSVTSSAMIAMIVLSPLIAKRIPERWIISIGLLLYATMGILPVFVQSFPVIFASRVIFGLGTGLVNAKAITIIGERFTGNLQQQLQGIRCSMETLGQTILTLIAGRILDFGWNYTFLVFGVGYLILILYLLFVPKRESEIKPDLTDLDETAKLTAKDMPFILGNAFLGFLMVSTNDSLSLRISSFLLETGIGSAADGSTIMSISTFAGFLAGLVFGTMTKKLKHRLLPVSMFIGIAGLFTVLFSSNLFVASAGAVFIGFCVTCCTSKVFGSLSEHLPVNTLSTANTIVLVGCNLGAFTAPFVLKVIDSINPSLNTSFLAYGIVYGIVTIWIILKQMFSKTNNLYPIADCK